MKSGDFRYRKPASVAEALQILHSEGPGAKLIAGGQSLGPMLNLRVVQPTTLIDISALAELRRAGVDGDEIVLGACVTHADIEDGRAGSELGALLARIAGGIAYRAVRNRGTIGGSLCHADPAADWVTALPALGAVAVIRRLGGERRLPVEDFIAGALTTALEPSEMLIEVRVRRPHPQALFGYAKSCRKVGEFAKASAAVLVDPHAMEGRIALGALDGAPRVENAESLLIRPTAAGQPLRINPAAANAALAAAGVADPARRHIHATILARAVLGMAV
jgi:carbon-monoxide dehydrogenase medium subunit